MEIMFQEIFTRTLTLCHRFNIAMKGAEVGQFAYDMQIFSFSSIIATCGEKWMWSFSFGILVYTWWSHTQSVLTVI